MTCYILCLSIHCLGRHSFIVNFHDMDNWLITMSTAPNNPKLSPPPQYSNANIIPPPVRQDSNNTRDWKRERMGLLCLHLPIRPHGTKFFFLFFCNETNIYDSSNFSMYMLYQERETFLFAKESFGRRCREHILGEGQGRHRARGHANLSWKHGSCGRAWVLEYVLSSGWASHFILMKGDERGEVI